MAVESPSLFAQVIQEHLELKRRNAALEHEMPLERYLTDDPFENHPLFKTEEQARLEETMDGTEPAVAVPAASPTTAVSWPGEETTQTQTSSELEDSLWGQNSRDFDWGD